MQRKHFMTATHIILVFVLALGVFRLFRLFPPTGDDWILLGNTNLSPEYIWNRGIYDWQAQNGRILGNFLHMIGVFAIPSLIAKGVCLFVLIFGFRKITDTTWLQSAFITLAAVLFLPKEILREVWVWNAGFYNYVPPMVLIILTLTIWKSEHLQIIKYLSICFLSLAACLFMENVTVYLCLLSLVFIAVSIRKPTLRARSFCLAAGTLLGTIAMFSSPSYYRVVEATDGYRTVGRSIPELVQTVANNWTESFAPFVLSQHHLLLVSMVTLTTIAYLRSKKERKTVHLLSPILLVLFSLGLSLAPKPFDTLWLNLPLHLAFYSVLLWMGWNALKDQDRLLFVYSVLSAMFIVAPLMPVTPVGARNFFSPVIFHLLIVFLLLKSLRKTDGKIWSRAFTVCLIVLVFIQGNSLTQIYSANYKVHQERVSIAENATRSPEYIFYMPLFPYPDYLHGHDPSKMGYRYYHEKPLDIFFRPSQ